jgi:hypothetical protein
VSLGGFSVPKLLAWRTGSEIIGNHLNGFQEFSARRKLVAAGFEIYEILQKSLRLNLRTPLIPKRLYAPSEESSGLGGACGPGYRWLPIIEEVPA